MGLLKKIEIDDGTVNIELRITSPSCMMVGYFIEEANKRVGRWEGVNDVQLETDAGFSWREEMMSDTAKQSREEHQQVLAEQYRKEQSATAGAALED